MKRLLLALAFGVFLTVIPWIARPLLGDRSTILWLPGFVATSHWFPQGLHGANRDTAKGVGCLVNVLLWAGGFVAVSFLMNVGWMVRELKDPEGSSQTVASRFSRRRGR